MDGGFPVDKRASPGEVIELPDCPKKTEKALRRQNTHRALQEMSDIGGDRAVEVEEEEEEMMIREGWG